jgi:chromosome segregation ATPase
LRADVEKKLNKLSGKFSKLKSRLNMVTDTCSLFTRELEEKREVLKNMRAKLGTASYEAKTNYLTAQELTKKIEILNELIAKQETAITEANARTDDVKIKYAALKQ